MRIGGLLLLIAGGFSASGLSACSDQTTSETYQAAGRYLNNSQRDNIIKNWQRRVQDSPQCEVFKTRLEAAGKRHESAASAAFASDMMRVMEEVDKASCRYQP